MESEIISTYSNIFFYADTHQWEKCQACFTDEPEIDYASLSGQPAAKVRTADLMNAWKSFLPKFKFTMHYLTNHRVTIDGATATAFCYGHAIHHLPDADGGDLWGVYGTYEFELLKTNDGWKVKRMKYNHKYQDGNPKLPALAASR
jgi:hypothetical protein